MITRVQTGQEFIFHDGTQAATLTELSDKIQTMPEEEFRNFVAESKNDFASWTQYALGETVLSERLRSTTNREITLLKIHEKLDELKAQENLYTIAQASANPKSNTAGAQTAEKNAERRPPSRMAFIVKEVIVGIILGIVLGLFLDRIIITLLH